MQSYPSPTTHQADQRSLAQLMELKVRKTRRTFLGQINQMVHWEPLVEVIEKYYTKGKASTGRKAYPALLLLKMSLLQTWYNLSDYAVEEQLNDSLSFMHFCGLQLHDQVPDHSVLSRFRTVLSKAGVWESLLVKSTNSL